MPGPELFFPAPPYDDKKSLLGTGARHTNLYDREDIILIGILRDFSVST